MLKVIGEAGRDEKRNALVEVECGYCGMRKVMRRGNLKRSKSCGCIKVKRFKEMVREREKKPIQLLPQSVWSEYDDSKMTPLQIIAAVRAKGLYVSSVVPKSERVVALDNKVVVKRRKKE